MSRRSAKHTRVLAPVADAGELRRVVDRLIEKRQYKDALKRARAGFAQNSCAETRQLVERTSLLRARDLAGRGMPDEAKAAARQLLEFCVTDSGVVADLVLLLPQLGLSDKALALQAKLTSPEVQPAVAVKLADEQVLRPHEAPGVTPEVRELAGRVRQALSALQEGNENQALELLRDIPRSSPLADWRYFVRGLAAFQRGSLDEAISTWERLDSQRPAYRISAALQGATTRLKNDAGRVVEDFSRLERVVFGDFLLHRIERLQAAIEESNWKAALKMLAPLRAGLRRLDIRLAQRLTEILIGPFAAETFQHSFDGARRLVENFTDAAEPLPIDPEWHRLWALLWEQASDDSAHAIRHWERYIEALDKTTASLPVPRERLQALVWRHIADLLSREEDSENLISMGGELKPPEPGGLRRRRIEALERSLKLDGSQRRTHETLVEAHREAGGWEAAAAAARRMLEAFPDALSMLDLLIAHHMRRDEPAIVLSYLDRIRAAKPLDDSYGPNEWWARVALARHCAVAGQFDEARAQLARAESLQLDASREYPIFVRKAMLEFKAGQPEQAEEFLRRACGSFPDATAVWLLASVEALRYALPAAVAQRFLQEWKSVLKKKPVSETAGAIAETMLGYLVWEVDYPGRDQQLRDAIDYLRRTTRIKYREPDLLSVCVLLQQQGSEPVLAEKLLRRGEKLFPKSAKFLTMAAAFELSKGPLEGNLRHAERLLKRALALAEAPNSPDAALAGDIRRQLIQLDDIREALPPFPFGFSGKAELPLPHELRSTLDAMLDELGIAVDSSDDDERAQPYYDPFSPPSRPSYRKKKK